ncbi:hypothetical protein N0V88_007292 [Collariella sp. IMI 366227]|nr:hypothetical protein N0V88_007292 [Collariella sp. IMI 366227]
MKALTQSFAINRHLSDLSINSIYLIMSHKRKMEAEGSNGLGWDAKRIKLAPVEAHLSDFFVADRNRKNDKKRSVDDIVEAPELTYPAAMVDGTSIFAAYPGSQPAQTSSLALRPIGTIFHGPTTRIQRLEAICRNILNTNTKFTTLHSPKTSTFPFLSLPAELRLQIYAYLFLALLPIYPQPLNHPLRTHRFKLPPINLPPGTVLSMATANKLLSREVTAYIYTSNTFHLSIIHHRGWINRIGHKNSSLLQNLIIVCEGRVKVARENLGAMMTTIRKRAFENLENLTVQAFNRGVNTAFVVRTLLALPSRKAFHKLEKIRIDLPQGHRPVEGKRPYEMLAEKAGVCVVVRYGVHTWENWRYPRKGFNVAVDWLEVDGREVKRKMEKKREEKKEAARKRKEEKMAEKMVEKME